MKRNKHYTINFTNDEAETLETLARITQRKPSELLRLLVVPILEKELAKACVIESETKPAKWTPDPLDKLPKL